MTPDTQAMMHRNFLLCSQQMQGLAAKAKTKEDAGIFAKGARTYQRLADELRNEMPVVPLDTKSGSTNQKDDQTMTTTKTSLLGSLDILVNLESRVRSARASQDTADLDAVADELHNLHGSFERLAGELPDDVADIPGDPPQPEDGAVYTQSEVPADADVSPAPTEPAVPAAVDEAAPQA